MQASLSANTKMMYQTALRNFNKFMQTYCIDILWPVPVKHIILYIAFCFEKNYSPSTIMAYISGISFMHKINGYTDPAANFAIQKMLEGCKRSRKTKDMRSPISLEMLEKILLVLKHVCYTDYETTLFKTVFSMAYFGLFRVSELVYTNLDDRALTKDDIILEKGAQAVRITLKVTKTNQMGHSITIRIAANEENIDMFDLLKLYMSLVSPKAYYFFCHADLKPVTRYQFCSVLSQACKLVGMNSKTIKSHSFRIGRATDLAKRNVSDDTIKQMGRWTSNSFSRYIRV